MIAGCVQRLVALVGCLIIVGVTGTLAWTQRDRLMDLYRAEVAPRVRGALGEREVRASAGRATAEARRSAERKERALARSDGPPFVVLTADEMASLVRGRLDSAAPGALDSVRVRLEEDRVTLEGTLRTSALGDALGPLAAVLADREPFRAGGALRVEGAGVLSWRLEDMAVKAVPIPGAGRRRVVRALGGGGDGAFLLGVPLTVGDVRVHPNGVTFYRWVR